MWKFKRLISELFSSRWTKILIGVVAALLVVLLSIKVVQNIQYNKNSKSPILSISATNAYIYDVNNPVRKRHFNVKAKHKNGSTTTLSTDEYKLDRTTINNYGESTTITITLQKQEEISCTCEVEHKREEEIGWYCGTPNIKDLSVTLYSNGELNFSGTGDMMAFSQVPWLSSDKNLKITAITFDDSVEITNLNQAFCGLEELTYVDAIPLTVKYMNGTFKGCSSLIKAPEWSQSVQLEDISYAYQDCSSLQEASAFPVSIRDAEGTYQNCSQLAQSPDMSQPVNLMNISNMYQGCKRLALVNTLPPNTINMTSTFEECINLRDMPQLPLSVVYLNRTFYNCCSLRTPKSIPAAVMDLTETFYGCEQLDGSMSIETSNVIYDNCFMNAVSTSRLDLTGSSPLLKEIALTGNANITVNGKTIEGNRDHTLLEESTPDEALQYKDTTQQNTTSTTEQ